MNPEVFRDRRHAGQVLARSLAGYAGQPGVIVLALPRGGVPVAYEVAQALQAPLDVFVVRKLGVPGHEELAMGAIASGGVRVLNDDVVPSACGISPRRDRRGGAHRAARARPPRAALPRRAARRPTCAAGP